MKIFRKNGSGLMLGIVLLFSVSSCDLFDLNINTDPNNPSQASLDLLLTNVMLNASSTFAGGLNNAASGFMGQTTSNDDHNMNNASWNGTWNFLYANPLNDLERIIVAATAQGNNPHYLAVAQILKAYYFSLMVDLWGDLPYFTAFKGDQGDKAPAYDDDKLIYADLIKLCDQAVVNIALTSPVRVLGDVMYNNGSTGAATQMGRWRKAAKSLKLRLLLQISRADASVIPAIQALATEGDLILTAADDFQFKFGALQNPDDRHPWYQNGYSGGEASFSYYTHQLMYEMMLARDPRLPFYVHRQTSIELDPADPTDKQTIPCSQRTDCKYGYLVKNPIVTQALFGRTPAGLTTSQRAYLAGFFGRDRADPSGIPNDNPIRTTVGTYPAAGLWDTTTPSLGGGNKGRGDGIFPMITSWMVNFYLLESQIVFAVNTGKTDATLLTNALNTQVAKVFALGIASDGNASTNTAAWTFPLIYKSQATFVADAVAAYPAGTAAQKMQYVMKQAWFANHGNGFEIYNGFRRTGYPNDIQKPLQVPRQFALRLPYAQDELNLNTKTPTVVYDSPADAIFWDILKYQF